jgi:hypothetical protein
MAFLKLSFFKTTRFLGSFCSTALAMFALSGLELKFPQD